jgi:hypothetical protein
LSSHVPKSQLDRSTIWASLTVSVRPSHALLWHVPALQPALRDVCVLPPWSACRPHDGPGANQINMMKYDQIWRGSLWINNYYQIYSNNTDIQYSTKQSLNNSSRFRL